MKVLVVDDDVVSRMVLMHLVDALQGYEVAEAEDGQDAWEQLSAGLRPAVCFCDMRMPRLSGMDLLARIKADPGLAAINVVMVSSANEVDVVQQATSMGAAGYIIKPFHGEQVRDHLARLAPPAGAVPALDASARTSEAPSVTLKRLGIDAGRLQAYLGGFDKQLAAARDEVPPLIGTNCEEARRRVERLLTGCQTLGLHGAAEELGRLGPIVDPVALLRALELAAAAVAEQLEKVRRLTAAA